MLLFIPEEENAARIAVRYEAVQDWTGGLIRSKNRCPVRDGSESLNNFRKLDPVGNEKASQRQCRAQ